MAELTRDTIIGSVQAFKERRDAVLGDDVSVLEHNLKRFVKYCESDPLMLQILKPITDQVSIDPQEWLQKLRTTWSRQGPSSWEFPDNPTEELVLRYELIKDISATDSAFLRLGRHMGVSKTSDGKTMFLNVIARPLLNELSRKVSNAANIPTSEIRAMQAVYPERIPGEKETKIFLSHKTIDKPLVQKYYRALKELGYDPWLDEHDMPAGTNPDRGIKQGFKEGCSVVFFITENFKDETFIATEIENAIIEKRSKGEKFAIITLRFSDEGIVPDLLENYIYVDIKNDLDGLYEIVRALPVELGAILWKEKVIS